MHEKKDGWRGGWLASIFSHKSADNLTKIFLYVMSHFSLAGFQDFSLPLPLGSLSMIYLGVELNEFILLELFLVFATP